MDVFSVLIPTIFISVIILVVARLVHINNKNRKNPLKRESSQQTEPTAKPTNPNLALCPDCYKEVSKNANTCIHCGCNLRLGFTKWEQNSRKFSRGAFKLGCSIMTFQLAVVILIILYVLWSVLV